MSFFTISNIFVPEPPSIVRLGATRPQGSMMTVADLEDRECQVLGKTDG